MKNAKDIVVAINRYCLKDTELTEQSISLLGLIREQIVFLIKSTFFLF